MSYNTKNYSEQNGDKWVVGGTLEIKDGATVTGLAANPLTAATADTLGGVKVGTTLSISSGVLNVKQATSDTVGAVKPGATLSISEGALDVVPAEAQADSTATTVAGLKEDLNALLAKLIAAGFMEAPES